MPSGGILYLPTGNYLVTSPITFGTNMTIQGDGFGTLITYNGSTCSPLMKMVDTTLRQVHIKSIRTNNTSPGNGTVINASYFIVSRLQDLWLAGNANIGIDFNANTSYYNVVHNCRLFVGGVGSIGIRFDTLSNENTVDRVRIGTDANSTGIYNNSQGNGLYGVDVETGALIAIDIGPAGHQTTIMDCFLDTNQTNLRLASGVKGVGVFGGYIGGATVAEIVDNGAIYPFIHAYGQGSVNLFKLPSPIFFTPHADAGASLYWSGQTTTNTPNRQKWNVPTGSQYDFMINGAVAVQFSASVVNLNNLFLKAVGGLAMRTQTKSTNYTLLNADLVILADATSAAFTLTLPAANANSGQVYQIKKIDSTVNLVTIARAGSDTFEGGATSIAILTQFDSYTIVSDGTSKWYVFANKTPVAFAQDADPGAIGAGRLWTPTDATAANFGLGLVRNEFNAGWVQYWKASKHFELQPFPNTPAIAKPDQSGMRLYPIDHNGHTVLAYKDSIGLEHIVGHPVPWGKVRQIETLSDIPGGTTPVNCSATGHLTTTRGTVSVASFGTTEGYRLNYNTGNTLNAEAGLIFGDLIFWRDKYIYFEWRFRLPETTNRRAIIGLASATEPTSDQPTSAHIYVRASNTAAEPDWVIDVADGTTHQEYQVSTASAPDIIDTVHHRLAIFSDPDNARFGVVWDNEAPAWMETNIPLGTTGIRPICKVRNLDNTGIVSKNIEIWYGKGYYVDA